MGASSDLTLLRGRAQGVKPASAPPAPAELESTERLALFITSIRRESSLELFEGLRQPERATARAFARQATNWDSATRQGQLSRAFGLRPSAESNVAALIRDSAPPLRRAIVAALPEALQSEYPHLAHSSEAASPAMRLLARRLVREVMR